MMKKYAMILTALLCFPSLGFCAQDAPKAAVQGNPSPDMYHKSDPDAEEWGVAPAPQPQYQPQYQPQMQFEINPRVVLKPPLIQPRDQE